MWGAGGFRRAGRDDLQARAYKRRAKADRLHARLLRELLMDRRLPPGVDRASAHPRLNVTLDAHVRAVAPESNTREARRLTPRR